MKLMKLTKLTQKIENLAAKSGLLYRFAKGYYINVIKKEAVLANITHDDNLLCVGGGTCPFSAILFHQVTGAKVTVIDNNSLCVPKARRVIKQLGLEKHVSVFCKDGTEADYAGYTVIHLALQVSPMESVFTQAEKLSAPGTRLLIRRPKKHLNCLYCKSFKNLLSRSPYTTHKSRSIGSTLLYTK
ncbi:MAG: hypothetical protein FWF79_06040 [Defluviitaleaceae bacterium]|nr:hypothetical protein [Defluviitaleaceae bacterium]